MSLDSFDTLSRKPKKAKKAEPATPEPVAPEPATAEEPVAEPQPTAEPEPVAEAEPDAAPEPAAAREPEPAAASGGGLFSLKDELDLDDLVDKEDEAMEPVAAADQDVDDHGIDFDSISASSEAPEPVAAEPAASAEDALDETGMSWLQDEEPLKAAAASGGDDVESLFDEEDDFFDLAAELEEELGVEAMAQVDDGVSSLESQEGTLEEIIEGFKAGVAEHLSEEDYDTHFNLGIAYREMGLLDEAIGEFQVASKDERHLAESAGMLGMCFMEKGLPELAVRWYKKGLETPDINEDATLGLLYDLATTYESMGEPESAYRTFVEIYGINTNFRDVASKMQELAPQKPA